MKDNELLSFLRKRYENDLFRLQRYAANNSDKDLKKAFEDIETFGKICNALETIFRIIPIEAMEKVCSGTIDHYNDDFSPNVLQVLFPVRDDIDISDITVARCLTVDLVGFLTSHNSQYSYLGAFPGLGRNAKGGAK